MKELIQLLLEAFHHLAHHPLDPAHGGGNVLPLYALGLQLGIGPEDLQGCGQVIAQKGMELGRPFRVALLILEDLGGDDPDAVDLRREGRVFDGVVHRPDLGQHRVLLVHRGSLLLLRLSLLCRGRVVQPLTGEDQPVPAVVQETQGEQPVIQHILQAVPHLGRGGTGGGRQRRDGDGLAAADHGQIVPVGAHLLLFPQAGPQHAGTAA